MQATSASASALFDTYHTVDLYSIHSLHSPSLSPAQNREKYGIANSLHAHHYVVTVGFRGPVNATSHLLSELPDLAIVELLNRVHLVNPLLHYCFLLPRRTLLMRLMTTE